MSTPTTISHCSKILLLTASVFLISSLQAADPQTGSLLPSPPKTGPIAGTIIGDLDVSSAVSAIQAQNHDVRERLAVEIEQRLKASAVRIEGLKARTNTLYDLGKSEFEKAMQDIETRKGDLLKCLSALPKLSSNAWDGARSELVASYALYGAAVARAEIAMTKTATPPVGGTPAAKSGNSSLPTGAAPPRT